jgi:hypothetical protein
VSWAKAEFPQEAMNPPLRHKPQAKSAANMAILNRRFSRRLKFASITDVSSVNV